MYSKAVYIFNGIHNELYHQWCFMYTNPAIKVYGANMGPTWVLSAPDGPHVGPMNLAIRVSSIGSDYDSSPFRSQAIFLNISINNTPTNRLQWKITEINPFSLTKLRLKLPSLISPPFCPGRDEFINVSWWRHMATEIWINIASGNVLLPDGTRPLPEPQLTYHQQGLVAIS